MKNLGLIKFLDADVNSFTSDIGLKIRKIIAKPLKVLLKIATPEKIHVIKYPQLKKNIPYIFVSNHGFSNDIISALATIDRSVYLLMGSTNQVEYNKLVYAAWELEDCRINKKGLLHTFCMICKPFSILMEILKIRE